MSTTSPEKQSQLIAVLREGVSVIQMILFKEVRATVTRRHPKADRTFQAMLTGAIVNEIFGSANPEPRFARFCEEHRGVIEQELLALRDHHPALMPPLTDALRILSLCDHQEGQDSSTLLTRANELGILQVDRAVPLPSTFMTLVRGLGEQHGLIIAPVQITPEQDQSTIH